MSADGLRAGQLLVAAPVLVDPHFLHAVVLLLDVDEDGALGVILNRPSAMPVGALLEDWADLAREPGVVFQGGPVGTDSALAVAALDRQADDEPVGWRRVYDDTGLIDLDTPTELLGDALAGIRVFAGYAGWGSGQLEDEIEEGAWYVVPAQPEDLFSTDPASLWGRVLRRQPGELAWVSTKPVDPTWN